jgi:uncharacterized membrane protein (DUF373 family)
MKLADRWRRTCDDWALQSYYQRFESAVALVLTAIISLIILVALYRLAATVIGGLLLGVLDPLDYQVFQAVFGEILTLLIALLAVARKFIILDINDTSAGQLLGLAAVTLVLGVTYWLIRERDVREAVSKRTGT